MAVAGGGVKAQHLLSTTGCPCSIWCCGLTTCLLRVGPFFRNLVLNKNWSVSLT